jgi:hypothetical protein
MKNSLEHQPPVRTPTKGEKIYVPTAWYIDHGEDDFEGGVATIKDIHLNKHLPDHHVNYMMVSIEERPGTQYNWRNLLEHQEEWKDRYKDQIAHPDPDYN